MNFYELAGAASGSTSAPAQEATTAAFQINVFWIIVAATTFVFFFLLVREFALSGLVRILEERRERIEQGLKDAEQARRDREMAEQERINALNEARREASSIIDRAQRVANETREQDIKATREELDRMRERATADIDAEKQRAIGELRAEVADLALAAASRVVRESMNNERQRRLVEEFLVDAQTGSAGESPAGESRR